MASPRLVLMLLAASLARPVLAADLEAIERDVVREPSYKTSPRYCLLVFGPEAATRVWLVHDGNVLYVDRNGNGDLTEPGEKVVARKRRQQRGRFEFDAGDVTDGTALHQWLRCTVMPINHLAKSNDAVKDLLAKHPRTRGYGLEISTEFPAGAKREESTQVRQYVAVRDLGGLLQFAERPDEAPIVHFGGPMTVTLARRVDLVPDREIHFEVLVGTPGLGPGTLAAVSYENFIPDDVYPQLEIVFPPQREGSAPIRKLYELKERC